MLGKQPHTARFRYNAENPLPVDVLVVDEASMVDLSLMTQLLEAVPFSARVILLGDEDQLSSVEAGAILGDICMGGGGEGRVPVGVSKRYGAGEKLVASPMEDCIVRLTQSYRFDEGSGIGNLARVIRNGDATAAMDLLANSDDGTVKQVPFVVEGADPSVIETVLVPYVRDYYQSYLKEPETEDRLRQINRFRILCAHRLGMTGVEQVNLIVEKILQDRTRRSNGSTVVFRQADYDASE